MRVFITGASGFIGSHVTRALINAGHEVKALALPGDPISRLHDVADRFDVLRGTLSDIGAHRPLLAEWEPDSCIHLAWYAEPGKYLHSPENIPSLMASLALLNELTQLGCRHVVMAGTCAEYDTDLGFLRENGPTSPSTVYAATKLSMNLIGQQVARANGIDFAWARLFYLYGPQEDERRVVPALICSLLKGQPFPATRGEQVRDYLHVEDVASALVTLVECKASGMFNIASGEPVTIRRLMETVGEIVARPELIQFGAVPYRDWEPPFICGSNQRLRDLGWTPNYALKEGLRQTVTWWEKHGTQPAPRRLL